MQLSGTRVLITGASSGIGAATARAVAAAGGQPIVAGRDPVRLAAVERDCGGPALAAELPAGATELAERAVEAAGRVDVLVNNAGIGWSGAFDRITEDDVERVLAVDLTAPILLTRALLPEMVRRGRGRLIYVSSISGATGVRYEAVYSAAKAGLISFAESLRYELSGTGVGVSVIVPGVIDTPFFERRGTPYERSRPRPIPASRVARAIVRAIEREQDESYVPRWLRVPARLRGAAPVLYRRLAARYG